MFLVMQQPKRASPRASPPHLARTIRFPETLRRRIAADAERCGRSFEAQVIALLRRHYGEDVDIAPTPSEILALASASVSDLSASDLRALTHTVKEPRRSSHSLPGPAPWLATHFQHP